MIILRRREIIGYAGTAFSIASQIAKGSQLSNSPELGGIRPFPLPKSVGTRLIIAPSRDGKRLLLFGGNDIGNALLTPDRIVRRSNPAPGLLETISTEDWSTLWRSASLFSSPFGSFFADSYRCLIESPETKQWHIVNEHGAIESSHRYSTNVGNDKDPLTIRSLYPYRDNIAIGRVQTGSSQYEWIHLDLANERVVRRSPPLGEGSSTVSTRGFFTPISFSSDCETFAYGFDHQIEVRRSSDLSLLLVVDTKPSLEISRVAVSDGAIFLVVALTAFGSKPHGGSGVYGNGVLVYDIKRRSLIQRLATDANNGIAISPDSRLLATAGEAWSGPRARYAETRICITSLNTGKVLGYGEHIRVEHSRSGSFVARGLAPDGLFFIPGRKLLASTGSISKLWTVD